MEESAVETELMEMIGCAEDTDASQLSSLQPQLESVAGNEVLRWARIRVPSGCLPAL